MPDGTTMPDPVVEMRDLECKMGHAYLLNHINWRVGRGEHWAVYGMNGCGKTTLLSTIAGFKHYTAGALRVFGEAYSNENALEFRRRIGFVSSSFFDKHYSRESVLDIVLSAKSGVLGLDWGITLADVAHAKKLLRALHVGQKIDRQYDMLSKGERQSVLIARALFNEPELLLLDEPCGGLDVYKRESLFRLIDALARETGITILYVTQHIEEIGGVFDRALLLRNGYVFDQGPAEEMLSAEKLSAFLGYSLEIRRDAENRRHIRIRDEIAAADIRREHGGKGGAGA